MIIFDTLPSITVLATVPLVCERCAVHSTQRIVKRVMRFSALRLQLFPVATSFYMTCDSCHSTTRIAASDADNYSAPAASALSEYTSSTTQIS